MGFNVVRSVAVAFAMRQLRRKERYSAGAQVELERIWKESLDVASISYVLAKQFTRLSADQAMLAGLLHVLGQLYIVMRAEEMEVEGPELKEVTSHWHPTIGKAILESWGLPETLQRAMEHQDDVTLELEGPVSITHILISAKLLSRNALDKACPAFQRLQEGAGDKALDVLNDYAEEISRVRSSLSE
jgi:HD-like signal output (HDOD) protein